MTLNVQKPFWLFKTWFDGKELRLFSKKKPAQLPWQDLDVDLVFECTGIFREKESMQKHLQAGAKRVILSAPEKTGQVDMIVHGTNKPQGTAELISCASCTTNCIAPVVEVIGRTVGVK